MPANDYSIGRDLTFVIVASYGTLELSGVTSYKATRDSTDLKHKGIDGLTRHANLPDGWTLAINIERKDPVLDRFFARLESDYFRGVNIRGGTILETITETDGSVSQYRYEGVVLKYDGGGEYKGDSFVSTSLTAMCSRRIQVS